MVDLKANATHLHLPDKQMLRACDPDPANTMCFVHDLNIVFVLILTCACQIFLALP